MPDITMCGSMNCTVRQTCYRNPHSGTQPSEWRQSWFVQIPGENQYCLHYWPTTAFDRMTDRLIAVTGEKEEGNAD